MGIEPTTSKEAISDHSSRDPCHSATQYNIKKKEEVVEQLPQEEPNPLMRKKKTPEELAAEAEAEDLDDFTKLKNSIESQVNELKTQIESKCVMQ
ncbi:hypothetical protein ACKWTF_013687 [Chironomus riparius]